MKLSLIVALFQKKEFLNVLEYIDHNKHLMAALDKEQITKIVYYQGLCYANLKKHDKALECFTICINSNLPLAYIYQCRMLRGYIYTVLANLRLAEAEFAALIDEGYESARAYAAAAHIAYKLQKTSAAVRYLQKALHIDPDNVNALNSMSYILADNNVKLPFALKYIEQVLQKHPRVPAYLDTYGLVLMSLRRFADAKRVLKYAVTISNHPDIKKHYKMAHSEIVQE